MSYVTINQLSKSFKDQQVLHNLSLSFQKGELVTLLGPSGCGKSTLLRILSGLTEPDQGSIIIDGRDVSRVQPKDREVGMVFQSYALFPNMTAAENIAFGLEMKKISKTAIAEKVARMIELVGLNGKERAYPRELSGGQQQRVALARSLVTEPKVLLLDEPLSALDAQIRKNLQHQLRSIQKELNMTTVLVTHDQEEAMAISDRIFILNQGQIVQHGTPHSIYTRPENEFVARFMGNYNVLSREQIARVFAETTHPDAELFAIRPEALAEHSVDPGYSVTGRVENVTMLGNVTRYHLVANGVRFVAEHLHRSTESVYAGMTRTLYLHQEDVIPLR